MYFSIIIPVYNASSYIQNCITSIKNQTFTDFEAIFVNDGSTDDSARIISSQIKGLKNFKLINKENSGVSETRNLGIAKAKGDYIVFIDSDDWIEPDLLEQIAKVNNNFDIIQYDFYKANSSGKKPVHIKSEFSQIVQGEGAVVWKRAFKKSLIKKIRFNKDLIGGEDYLFCVEAFLNAKSFFYLDKCLYNYNTANASSAMHTRFFKNLISQIQATILAENLLNEHDLLQNHANDIQQRYFWCLSLFNNWKLSQKKRPLIIQKILLKIIKMILL